MSGAGEPADLDDVVAEPGDEEVAPEGAAPVDEYEVVVQPVVDPDVTEAAAEVQGDIAALAAERDDYLDALRHLQADFENYKKRVAKQASETADRAAEDLLTKLLPVLDTVDLARTHGSDATADQIARPLVDALSKAGLERLDPLGEPFDPNEHDAVLHEAGSAEDGGPVVADVLRAGYRYKGRILRPAMVKVAG